MHARRARIHTQPRTFVALMPQPLSSAAASSAGDPCATDSFAASYTCSSEPGARVARRTARSAGDVVARVAGWWTGATQRGTGARGEQCARDAESWQDAAARRSKRFCLLVVLLVLERLGAPFRLRPTTAPATKSCGGRHHSLQDALLARGAAAKRRRANWHRASPARRCGSRRHTGRNVPAGAGVWPPEAARDGEAGVKVGTLYMSSHGHHEHARAHLLPPTLARSHAHTHARTHTF